MSKRVTATRGKRSRDRRRAAAVERLESKKHLLFEEAKLYREERERQRLAVLGL